MNDTVILVDFEKKQKSRGFLAKMLLFA